MKTEKFTLTSTDGAILHSVIWAPDTDVKAVLQITHGMTEHMGRYAELGKYFAKCGIAVAGYDLRGHGEAAVSTECASFGEGGWERSIADMELYMKHIKETFQGKPIFMLGFSLGSFMLREYLNSDYEKPAGAVIMGTGHQPSFILSIIMSIVKGQIKKSGFDGTTPLVKSLSFDTYNKRFAPCRTDFDWLCADTDALDKYINDEKCIKGISSGLFYDLLGSMKRTGAKNAYEKYPKDMPLYIMSGMKDPVGDFMKGTDRVIADMKKAGLTNVSVVYCAEGRHDILHDDTSGPKEILFDEITQWINKNS